MGEINAFETLCYFAERTFAGNHWCVVN